MLAAQLGFSADHAQKTSAMALIETWEDEDVDDHLDKIEEDLPIAGEKSPEESPLDNQTTSPEDRGQASKI